MLSVPPNQEHWRRRANEIRDLAARVRDPGAKAALLRVAADYEQLASRAEDWSNAPCLKSGASIPAFDFRGFARTDFPAV